MFTSKLLARAVRFGVAGQHLLVTIEINCEGCGEYTIVLPGHHIRAVAQALQEIIEHEPPDLTDGGEVEVVRQPTIAMDRN